MFKKKEDKKKTRLKHVFQYLFILTAVGGLVFFMTIKDAKALSLEENKEVVQYLSDLTNGVQEDGTVNKETLDLLLNNKDNIQKIVDKYAQVSKTGVNLEELVSAVNSATKTETGTYKLPIDNDKITSIIKFELSKSTTILKGFIGEEELAVFKDLLETTPNFTMSKLDSMLNDMMSTLNFFFGIKEVGQFVGTAETVVTDNLNKYVPNAKDITTSTEMKDFIDAIKVTGVELGVDLQEDTVKEYMTLLTNIDNNLKNKKILQ